MPPSTTAPSQKRNFQTAPLTRSEHAHAAELCVQTGLLLLQHGTESAVVEMLTRRLGEALGIQRVELALMANAITLTTQAGEHCITTVRRNQDRGINVHLSMEVQQLALAVESGKLDRTAYADRLALVKPCHYSRWLVILAVGVSCACFARLAHADWLGTLFAFLASAAGMSVRHWLVHRHFNPMIGFCAAAFVATSIAAPSVIYEISTTPRAVIAASVLFLVPGWPLLTGVSDMVKGYANVGISRITIGMCLGATTCCGIVFALTLWNAWGIWL